MCYCGRMITATNWRTLGAMARAGSDGIARAVDGGKAMEIDGDMVLCGRSDEMGQRGYTGSLAELAIWNTAITPQQVALIYTSVSSLSPIGKPVQAASSRYRITDRHQGCVPARSVCASGIMSNTMLEYLFSLKLNALEMAAHLF